jgi:hypothetical protein
LPGSRADGQRAYRRRRTLFAACRRPATANTEPSARAAGNESRAGPRRWGPPASPIDSIEPVDPIDSIDPLDPIDRIEPLEPIDRIDPADPAEASDPTDRAEPNDSADPTDAADSTEPRERHESTDHADRDDQTPTTVSTYRGLRRPAAPG